MNTTHWVIKEDTYPSHEWLAGKPRYSVIDNLGNVACVSSNKDYALGYMDCLNEREAK